MTNDEKDTCRQLARDTKLSAQQIADRVGCARQTAARYIKVFRKKQKLSRKV